MTQTNQIFSSSRFVAFLTKYFYENRNRLLIAAAIMVLIPIAFCTVKPYINNCYTTYHIGEYLLNKDPMWNQELIFFNILWIVLALAAGGGFYDSLKTKTSRISLLTSPASAFEKFLTFFAIYILGLGIVYTCGIFLGDAIRVWIYSGTTPDGIPVEYISPIYLWSVGEYPQSKLVSVIGQHAYAQQAAISIISFWGSVVFIQALFALGCSVWPKNSVLKTACFVMGFNMLIVWMVYLGYKTFRWLYTNQIMIESEPDTTTLITLSAIGTVIVTVFTWWLGYKRFKEWEVIKRW